MRGRVLALAVILGGVLTCGAQVSIFESGILTPSGVEGTLDWTVGWIQVEGFGIPPKSAATESQGILLAREAAIADARRRLMDILAGVPLTGSFTLQDHQESESAASWALTATLIGRAQLLPDREAWIVPADGDWRDGYYQVTLGLSLDELASASLPHVFASEEPENAEPVAGPAPLYTGVVIDARGFPVAPAVFISLLSMAGEAFAEAVAPLYVPSTTYAGDYDGDILVEQAMDDPRVGGHPILIRPIASDPKGRGFIIDNVMGLIVEHLGAATDILIRGGGSVLVIVD